jgi:hypothetical protein
LKQLNTLWRHFGRLKPLAMKVQTANPCHIVAMAQLLILDFSVSIRFGLTRQLQRVIAQCF